MITIQEAIKIAEEDFQHRVEGLEESEDFFYAYRTKSGGSGFYVPSLRINKHTGKVDHSPWHDHKDQEEPFAYIMISPSTGEYFTHDEKIRGIMKRKGTPWLRKKYEELGF